MRIISCYVSGLATEKEAQEELAEFDDWFRNSFPWKNFSIKTSASKGPYGWRAELEATEESA